MNGPLGEDGHFARCQHRFDHASSVLFDGASMSFTCYIVSLWTFLLRCHGDVLTCNGNNIIGCSWVIMRGQHPTWTQLDHSHGELVSYDGLDKYQR